MTKSQAATYARLSRTLEGMGVSQEDFESLLRIEKTLHRWHERECNGEVEVGESGQAYEAPRDPSASGKLETMVRIPNREDGALRRLATIMARYPKLASYVQGDPRGCALYVYEKAKLTRERYGCMERTCFCHDDTDNRAIACSSCGCRSADIDSCYSSVGVAMCV